MDSIPGHGVEDLEDGSIKTMSRVLEAFGMRKIKTYIQSGNAVFQTDEKDLS